ncbi:bromodomain and WD repeat-containing protein 1-like [Senna tora]|uniref:Bromodomain and WD repeat-containing protein 1-like n=1 Tax=Senna tora TaxID=362788 RepID=A0A834XBV3_9FABA|nr:bromodomain and WD repeat-containing protein 1-like [Senna tora]
MGFVGENREKPDKKGNRKLQVGLHSEYGYARSLAQFASHLGPVAWKIASKKIERCLPQSIKFGPGWVGENDVTLRIPVAQPSPAPVLSSRLQHFADHSSSGSVELKNDKISEKPKGNISSEKQVPSTHLPLDGHPTNPIPSCFIPSSSSFVPTRASQRIAEKAEPNGRLSSPMESDLENSNNTATRPMINGFNVESHMGKLHGESQPAGINRGSSLMIDTLSRSNSNFVHSGPANSINSDDVKLPEKSNISSSSTSTNSRNESLLKSMLGFHSPSYWQSYQKSIPGLPSQQKPDPIPPDLNIRFQAPGSPNTSRVDSTPDLALQL